MTDNDNSNKNPPISADELFMQTFPVHPMVAFFIALPLSNKRSRDKVLSLMNTDGANIYSEGHMAMGEEMSWVPPPTGMYARRLLLLFFFFFHASDNILVYLDTSLIEFCKNTLKLKDLKKRKQHPVLINLMIILNTEIKFVSSKANEAVGFEKTTLLTDRIFGYRIENGWFREISLNPRFMFRMDFSFDYTAIIGTRKKSEFWNVYVFLADVLPRIPEGEEKKIEWEVMHRVFMKRYKTLENFKYFFKKKVDEVCEIYPKAKGKVDADSDKKYLILQYAPPSSGRSRELSTAQRCSMARQQIKAEKMQVQTKNI